LPDRAAVCGSFTVNVPVEMPFRMFEGDMKKYDCVSGEEQLLSSGFEGVAEQARRGWRKIPGHKPAVDQRSLIARIDHDGTHPKRNVVCREPARAEVLLARLRVCVVGLDFDRVIECDDIRGGTRSVRRLVP